MVDLTAGEASDGKATPEEDRAKFIDEWRVANGCGEALSPLAVHRSPSALPIDISLANGDNVRAVDPRGRD